MIFQYLKKVTSNQFLRNVGWLGSAELANRIFRLATTVVIARILTQYDYGLVAIVLTIYEIANIFTLRSGMGSKLIQTDVDDLEVFCNTAYWMNWVLCLSLFAVQCALAFPIAWIYSEPRVIMPICALSITYLLIPTFAVQSALTFRENRLYVSALCNVVQSFFSNILTIILALMGFGMWAIVLPIILTMPVWIFINRAYHPWRVSRGVSFDRWRELLGFSSNILGVELLDKLRGNIDYLIVGRFLGVDALGLYFFAFNAGLGISTNVINTLTWSLFPYLCEVNSDIPKLKDRYFSSLKNIAKIIFPLVLLQTTLAPFYVPIVFGERWIAAIPILIIICLSALPRPFGRATGTLLQAVNLPRVDLAFNIIFTITFIIALLLTVNFGMLPLAISVLATHVLGMGIFSVWGNRYVFSKTFSVKS